MLPLLDVTPVSELLLEEINTLAKLYRTSHGRLVKSIPYCTLTPQLSPILVPQGQEIIYTDAPWRFKNFSMKELAQRGEHWARARSRPGYDTFHSDDLAVIPYERIAAKDAIRIDWITYPKMEEAIRAITYRRDGHNRPIWTFKCVAFVWVKTTSQAQRNFKKLSKQITEGKRSIDDLWLWIMGEPVTGIPRLWHFGSGFHTHANTEIALVSTRGNPRFRASKAVSQLIFAPVSAHSEKPQAIYHKIEELYGVRPSIEFYARASNPPPIHWNATGREFDGLDVFEALGAKGYGIQEIPATEESGVPDEGDQSLRLAG